MNTTPSIDFETIRRSVDLRRLVEDDLGPPGRNRRWPCPIHGGEGPNFAVTARHWKCWSCGAQGDVFDYIARREGITILEAARRLDPSIGSSTPSARSAPKRPAAPAESVPAWKDRAWQAAVERIIWEAGARLWSPAGRAALGWLRARGLADHTIRRFRLGFVAADVRSEPLEVLADRDGPRPIRVCRGVTIPWLSPGSVYESDGPRSGSHRWVGCNVRRLAADPFAPLPGGEAKCLALAGSSRGYLYPWPEILPTQGTVPALICEGEFDALLASQEAGHVVHAGTVGGSCQEPDKSALAALARSPWWLIASDHDGPGVEDARKWKERAPHKARRVMLPHGKDLTEFFQGGGNILEWVRAELARVTT